MKDVLDVGVLIVYLAIVAVLVKSANTAKIATALGNTFDGSISVAEQG
jgi:hypothetical protein